VLIVQNKYELLVGKEVTRYLENKRGIRTREIGRIVRVEPCHEVCPSCPTNQHRFNFVRNTHKHKAEVICYTLFLEYPKLMRLYEKVKT